MKQPGAASSRYEDSKNRVAASFIARETGDMRSYEYLPMKSEMANLIRTHRRDGLGNIGLAEMTVESPCSSPCRVCLKDAEAGESVLLCSYSPFVEPGPYRSLGPIFIHTRACEEARPAATAPQMLRSRLLSIRPFDSNGVMFGCDVVEGSALEAHITALLVNPRVHLIHVHIARTGCFACEIHPRINA